MLGDYTNGGSTLHNLTIQAAYDFNPTLQVAVPFNFGMAETNGKFQYRERLPQQKCDSMSLTITENTTGDPSEYVDLTNISFEVAAKKGVNKLPTTKSVG